jgi:NADH-quinone oxidoreductase subunit I
VRKSLYREEKYAAVYEINMLRCIFCGLCEEACPKEAIYLDGDIVPSDYLRKDFIYGKDKLVEAPLKSIRSFIPLPNSFKQPEQRYFVNI